MAALDKNSHQVMMWSAVNVLCGAINHSYLRPGAYTLPYKCVLETEVVWETLIIVLEPSKICWNHHCWVLCNDCVGSIIEGYSRAVPLDWKLTLCAWNQLEPFCVVCTFCCNSIFIGGCCFCNVYFANLGSLIFCISFLLHSPIWKKDFYVCADVMQFWAKYWGNCPISSLSDYIAVHFHTEPKLQSSQEYWVNHTLFSKLAAFEK